MLKMKPDTDVLLCFKDRQSLALLALLYQPALEITFRQYK